ncbi:MAG: hypothetical protein AAFQ51_15930 [Pseudomonadota bacterium]
MGAMRVLLALLPLLVACAPEVEVPPVRVEAPTFGASPINARYLDRTTVELGPVTTPGLWVTSREVEVAQQGWIEDQETGRATRALLLPRMRDSEVDLISVAAVRALGVTVPRLVVVTLYRDVRALPVE